MKPAFNPEPKRTRYQGKQIYQVDCRKWPEVMRNLGYPLRRRFPTKAEAQAWCRQLVVDRTLGRKAQPGPMALRSLSERYLKSVAAGNSPKTAKRYRVEQRKFVEFLRGLDLEDVRDVTPAVVDMYRAELYAEGLAANTIRSYLAGVHKLYSWANRMGYIQGNPADRVTMPRPESKRRNFTSEEQAKLLTETTPELAPLWTLLFLTGIRRIEAVRLRRTDAVLDSPAPFLRVHGKGDKMRSVPLTCEAQLAVRFFLGQNNGDALLPYGYWGIYDTWVTERDRLGLPRDLDLHSFRHTFISLLANRTGAPLTEVQAVAGHSSVQTTQLYVHRDESMLRLSMDRLAEELVLNRHSQNERNEKNQ